MLSNRWLWRAPDWHTYAQRMGLGTIGQPIVTLDLGSVTYGDDGSMAARLTARKLNKLAHRLALLMARQTPIMANVSTVPRRIERGGSDKYPGRRGPLTCKGPEGVRFADSCFQAPHHTGR
jgi:hypothetical protein